MRDRSRIKIATGGVRTGKTFSTARDVFEQILKDRAQFRGAQPLLYWFIAPTYQLAISQKIEAIDVCPRAEVDWQRQGGKKGFFDITHGRGTLCLRGNITIEMKSGDKPESLVARKVRGIWVTEAARVKIASLNNCRTRISNYDDSWIKMETSPLGHCAFYLEWVKPALDGKLPGVSLHQWTAFDSPYVSRTEIENAKATLPPSWFKRDYLASWDTFQGQIYDFDDARNVRESPAFKPNAALISADINTTSERPASFMVMLTDGNSVHVEREYHKVIGLDFRAYAADIAAARAELGRRFPYARVVIDPSAHRQFKKYLLDAGIQDLRNAKNDVLAGIRATGTVIHTGAFTVAPQCAHTIDQFKGYRWRTGSDGVVREQPDKSVDEGLMDAARYGVMDAIENYSSAVQVK